MGLFIVNQEYELIGAKLTQPRINPEEEDCLSGSLYGMEYSIIFP